MNDETSTASESGDVRRASAELASLPPETTLRAFEDVPELRLPARHLLFPEMDVDTQYLSKILLKTYERAPEDFETLLGIEGVGPKTLRALALASELIYGARSIARRSIARDASTRSSASRRLRDNKWVREVRWGR